MERFADALEEGFRGDGDLCLRALSIRESSLAHRIGLGRVDRYKTRYISYPRVASQTRAHVYHIVDHGYADLARKLPVDQTIATCHDLMLLRAQESDVGFRARRALVARFRWSTSYLRRLAHVVCDSAATMRDAERFCGVRNERMSVIQPGVSRTFRKLSAPRRAQIRAALARPDERIILSVSTGHGYKNTTGVLRVVSALRLEGLPVNLICVGRGLNDSERLLARSLGLDSVIRETGIVSEERLVELYNVGDILLFPSFHEGFGWPPLEAMSCGTPVVASRAPSVAEVVCDAGLLEDARDTAALTRAVRSVLTSAELASRLSTRGMARAGFLSWRRAIASYRQIYEQLIAAHEKERERDLSDRRRNGPHDLRMETELARLRPIERSTEAGR